MSVPRPASRFDDTVPNHAPPQLSLITIIRRQIRESNRSLRVCLPAKIVAVINSYSVDVQPLLQQQYSGTPHPVNLPICPGVPVSMPCGADFAVQYPLAVNDCGLLIFADRSLDAWLAGSGGLTDPQDARLHDLTDGIFVPGLLTDTQGVARADSTTDLVLENAAAHVRLKKSGQVAIGNAQADLAQQVATLANLVNILATAVATLPATPGKPIDPAQGQTAASALDVQNALNTIAGA